MTNGKSMSSSNRSNKASAAASVSSATGAAGSTTTKKELIDRIASGTNQKRAAVKKTVQAFLDAVIDELAAGNRLELRDFGVFEIRQRRARIAQNPKTLERVDVPPKKTVKFKVGRLMKDSVGEAPKAR